LVDGINPRVGEEGEVLKVKSGGGGSVVVNWGLLDLFGLVGTTRDLQADKADGPFSL
jgi:hypothetical protein